MFCTSLRRRKSYASILSSLTSPSSLGLRESDLKTHDISLPLPSTANSNTRATRQLRVLLLSPSTVSEQKLPSTIERIRRFASLTGGKDLTIVFLLYPGNDTSEEATTAGMVAYAMLQAEMINHAEIPSIPILPLPRLDGLSNLLKRHQAALNMPRASHSKGRSATSFELLRHCSNEPPMSESAAFILTDFFANLPEVAEACTTASIAPNSSSPSAGVDGTSTCMYDDDGKYTGNNTQATDEGSDQSKLRSFRDLTGEDQYCDLLDFWTVQFAA